MSYSADPVLDADRHLDDIDRHNAEVAQRAAMFEEMFIEAAAKANGDCLSHGDAEVIKLRAIGYAERSIPSLVPLVVTMQRLCESSNAGKQAMQALLDLAKDGNPKAMAAIKALAKEYGQQKGEA